MPAFPDSENDPLQIQAKHTLYAVYFTVSLQDKTCAVPHGSHAAPHLLIEGKQSMLTQRGRNAHGVPPLGFSLQKNTHNFAVGYVYLAYFELTHFHCSDLKIILITTL